MWPASERVRRLAAGERLADRGVRVERDDGALAGPHLHADHVAASACAPLEEHEVALRACACDGGVRWGGVSALLESSSSTDVWGRDRQREQWQAVAYSSWAARRAARSAGPAGSARRTST